MATASAPSPARAPAATAQVFVRDAQALATVQQALGNLGMRDAEFEAGDIGSATAALARRPSPRLLIVEIAPHDDPVARVNELANVCEPNTGVIVIGQRNDIVLYRALKQAGIAEYFFLPLVSDVVTRACNNVLTGGSEPQAIRTGKLVFVLGVRGGAGATTVAAATSWYLAETRQRWVMLLDLDLQNGDAALQLDATPSHALREAFEHPERVDKLFLERAVIHVQDRIDVLASLEPLGENVAIAEASLMPLLDTLLQRYRFVFVDMPPGIAAGLLRTLQLPSTCILVSNGSLVSAREIARWRAAIGPNSAQRATLHVLNQHGAPGALPDAEFVRVAGQPPDVTIPYDRDIAAASVLGIKAQQKVPMLRRGLAPLISHLSGEPAAKPRSVVARLFGERHVPVRA